MSKPVTYRFSFGPWNISEGGDPFGPDVRAAFPHDGKFALYKKLGFDGVQFHDDDVVPGLDDLKPAQIAARAKEVKKMLRDEGLTPEFVAPRLWFAHQTIDGAYTSNRAADRKYAWDRTRKCLDITRAIGSRAVVLWLAREGSYTRESKDARLAYRRLLETVDAILEYDREVEVWIEPKPNEPTDM
ncbi:MAG: TIM barrel protein, partial [Opitutaceae bacterium]